MALEDYLTQITRNIGQVPRDDAIAESFYGLNIVGRNAPIPLNTENHGFTFFTRPNLNLSYDNLVVDRVLSGLLLDSPYSIQRMVRCYLDPKLQTEENLLCPGVDPLNPFIPLLSNNLITLSGWEDFVLNTHTSTPGLYREEYSYVDDVPYNYRVVDLQASFRNIVGDPISYMLLMWGWYMGLVYEGRIMPYPENILYNRCDYNTRIYRLIMDPTRTYVTRIGANGASFPLTAPIGNIFNFSGDGSETPFPTANDQITVSFRSMGFTYYDHMLIYEFNRLGELWNSAMKPSQRSERMVKLQSHEKDYFNYRAYPRINEETLELEWWVMKDYYQAHVQKIRRQHSPVTRNPNE